MKFGGTSLKDLERISHVAERVRKRIKEGYKVIVIVSAMAGSTNKLINWTKEAAPEKNCAKEYDAVVSSGENITAGLLALALQRRDIRARSWQGWQVPLLTDNAHKTARIIDIKTESILASFENDKDVAVISGFQGLSLDGRITTLGRGGSDTTAVAFAAAFHAERCDIYTDVDGVYTTDPRVVRRAQRLERIAFEEMLELSSLGAKILQIRSVELAMCYNVKLRVLSSFIDDEGVGTLVCNESDIMEKNIVSGIAFSRDEAKMTLISVADRPGIAAAIFGTLADAGVTVDMIVQNIAEEGRTDMTFSYPIDQTENAHNALCAAKERGDINFHDLTFNERICKVSVVGIGMRSHVGVAKKMFETLASEGVNIQVISTSEIKISVLIERKYMELAVRALHQAFGLDASSDAIHS